MPGYFVLFLLGGLCEGFPSSSRPSSLSHVTLGKQQLEEGNPCRDAYPYRVYRAK